MVLPNGAVSVPCYKSVSCLHEAQLSKAQLGKALLGKALIGKAGSVVITCSRPVNPSC